MLYLCIEHKTKQIMAKRLKFSGILKNLKSVGYDFMKLYANNYKVYNKKLQDSRYNIWVWVAKGGYIEIDDLYDNTKQFIKTIRAIDWSAIKPSTSISGHEWKYTHIFYSHNNPKAPMIVSKLPMDSIIWREIRNELGDNYYDKMVDGYYDITKKRLFGRLDSYKCVQEYGTKELLNELDKIQSI